MGTWETGITSSDTFQDIYNDFFALYNKEHEISFICDELEKRYESVISDKDEANEYLFALAKAKWECGALDNKLLKKIKDIIESGSEINRWINLGATKSDLTKREKAINDFYLKLLENNEKPKKQKKIKLRDSVFKKGDCLSIDLQNGNYGAAIALSEQKNSEYGLNLLIVLDYYSTESPKQEDFKNGNCLIRKNARNINEPYFQYCYAQHYKKNKYKFDIIDSIDVQIQYDAEKGMYFYGHWNSLCEFIIYINTDGTKIQEKKKVIKYIKKGLFS
jgi:hypothetical protein